MVRPRGSTDRVSRPVRCSAPLGVPQSCELVRNGRIGKISQVSSMSALLAACDLAEEPMSPA